MSVVRVPIGKLVKLPEYQVRKDRDGNVRLDRETVKKYATAYREGCMLPPIKAARIKDSLIVLDGWHRLAALEQNDAREADVDVLEGLSSAEAMKAAVKANTTHGLPLTRAETRIAFHALIAKRAHIKAGGQLLSYAEWAAMLGNTVQRSTIHRWMWKHHRRIAEQMSKADEDEDSAGTFDGPPPAGQHEKELEKAVNAYLRSALAAASAIREPKRRATVLARFKRAAKDLREAHDSKPPVGIGTAGGDDWGSFEEPQRVAQPAAQEDPEGDF